MCYKRSTQGDLMRSVRIFILLLLAASPLFAQESKWEGEVTTARWPIFMTVQLGEQPTLTFLSRTVPIASVTRDGARLKLVAGAQTLEGEIKGDTFTGTLIEGDARLSFTFHRVEPLAAPKDRIERWQQDLDALSQRFIRYDRSFSAGERALFLEKVASIRKRLASLSDSAVMMEMAEALSLAQNGHTR